MNPFNFSKGFQLENESSTAECSDRELGNVPRFEITYPDHTLANQELGNVPRFEITYPDKKQSIEGTHLLQNEAVPTSCVGVESDKYHDDDWESTNRVLKHIDQLLMEEGGMDEETCMLQESMDFQAKERSFYELLFGQNHPPPSADDNYHNSTSSGSRHLIDVVYPSLRNDVYPTNNMTSVVDRFSYPPQINDFIESEVVLNFQKGVDDANKLLLSGTSIDEGKIKGSHLEEAREKNKKRADFGEEEEEEEERSKKLPAVYPESTNVPLEEFDNALIYVVGQLQKKLEACAFQEKGSSSKPKGRRRQKNQNQEEVIDFRSLLMSCAQSIAADDRHAADVLLKQIRKHSSPFGDGEQRLAHYFAQGLEARLAGTGSQMQRSRLAKRITASDFLRAYYTYIESSPFVRISQCISNKTIWNKARNENRARVHIIDFGILYGFQWPTYFKHLSEQEGGPPKLRITGIDFPLTGFRPAERVEETGRRLARYAEMFSVPFEFNAIAQNWESIKIEDLKLEKGEFVTVNCLYQAENLLDEAGIDESPRTMVLDLIRKIKPDYFIHGVISAAFISPFFVSRFREALFHYSSLYDMLETTIPRVKPERAMLENDVFGKEVLNVIACEDRERHVRTETYKQWRLRHLKAGFVQCPFERSVMRCAMSMVKKHYHRDFLIQEANDWLLMGWKGRPICAMSCWQPVSENTSFFDLASS